MGKKASLRQGTMKEGIPDVSEFRMAPFFVVEDRFFEGLEAVIDNGATPATFQPQLAWSEPEEATDSVIASPESILRCRIDRGDFPWVNVELAAPGGSPDNWEKWTDHILGSNHYKDLLASAGILRSVCAFRDIKISKNNAALATLFSRWSSDTHTFIASWGEFTVSIEDICELTGLDVIGEHTLSGDLNDEVQISDTLQQWYTKCACFKGLMETGSNKSSYGQWHRFCYEDMEKLPPASKKNPIIQPSKCQKDGAYLAAYIVAFLSRFLLPGRPHDCPNKLLFSLAAKLSKGKCVPIAALILGNLYMWLDQISIDMKRSMGRFDMVNYAPTILLMAFLYERFPKFAPRPAELSDGGCQQKIRIQRWHNRMTNAILATYIDEESQFCLRPYAFNHHTFSHNFFPDTEERFIATEVVVNTRAATVMLFIPCFLPTITDLGEGTVVYNPHRTMRQFGFDQGIPVSIDQVQPQTFKEYETSWESFTRKGVINRCSQLNFVLPPRNRLGHVSTNWNTHWANQALSLRNFVFEDAVHPHVVKVLGSDPTLRKPKKDSRKGNWRLYFSPVKKVVKQVGAAHLRGAAFGKATPRDKGKRKAVPKEKEDSPSGDTTASEVPFITELPLEKFKEAILASKRRKTRSSSSKASKKSSNTVPILANKDTAIPHGSKDGASLAGKGMSPVQDVLVTEEFPVRDDLVAADTPMEGDICEKTDREGSSGVGAEAYLLHDEVSPLQVENADKTVPQDSALWSNGSDGREVGADSSASMSRWEEGHVWEISTQRIASLSPSRTGKGGDRDAHATIGTTQPLGQEKDSSRKIDEVLHSKNDTLISSSSNTDGAEVLPSTSSAVPSTGLSNILKVTDVGLDVMVVLEHIDRRYPDTFEKVHFSGLDSRLFRESFLKLLVKVTREICEPVPDVLKERFQEFPAILNQFEILGFKLGWLRRRLHAGEEILSNALFEEYLNAEDEKKKLLKEDIIAEAQLKYLQEKVVEVQHRRTVRAPALQKLSEEQASRQSVLCETFGFNLFSENELLLFCQSFVQKRAESSSKVL